MNKTVSVNISGFIFNIEESAYDALQGYLDALRRQFKQEEGGDEIVADIEARIAELFQETLSDRKQVVTAEDVEAIIAQLGAPEDYADEGADPEPEFTRSSQSNQRSASSGMRSEHRKLYRDEDDSVIAGVCSGLAHYLNVDPVVLRVAFVIAFFMGFGFLAYVILWIAVPSAKTTSEKLRMKNRSINVDSIREEYQQADRSGIDRATSNFLDVLTNILKGLANVFRTLFGVLFLAGAAFMLLGAIFALFGFDLFFDNEYLMTWDEIYEIFIPHHTGFQLGVAGAILVHIALTIGLIYGGLRLLRRVGNRYGSIRWIAPVAFVVGSILVAFGVTSNAVQFSNQEEVREELHTEFMAGDTVELSFLNPLDLKIYHRHNHSLRLEYSTVQGETVYSGGTVSLNYRPTSEDHLYMEIIRHSDGRTMTDARIRAEKIIYDVESDSTGIQLSPYIGFERADAYRGQGVEVRLYIPDGLVLTNDLTVRQNLRHTRHHGVQVTNGQMRLLDAQLTPFEDDFYTRYYYFY